MNSVQYEELCRHFLAKTIGLPLDKITSASVPNPKRADLPQYRHQIDLCWETGDGVCLYFNIANAKWRETAKVEQGEVLLLQQVKENLAAHKAVMITNTDFTAGASAVAQDKQIALHIVRPEFDPAILPAQDRGLVQAKLNELASILGDQVFHHSVRYRAFDLAAVAPASLSPRPPVAIPNTTRVMAEYSNKAVSSQSHKGRNFGRGKSGWLWRRAS
jgi:hypothetical protein